MLRFLLVLALVFGLATPATAQAVTPRLRGEDPLALVGWWRVAATGETVVIDPSRFEVRSDTGTAEDPARPPSDLELRARGPVAALPTNLTPVGDLTGRWIPVDDVGDHPAYVEFAADGTWTGSDGCTPTGGSWLAGPDGAFLATARTLMTFVACPGVGVAPQVGAARRIGTDGPTVILLDADGTPVGHFHRA
jgi:hypothetical protein